MLGFKGAARVVQQTREWTVISLETPPMLFIFLVHFLFLKFSFKGINRLLSHQKLLPQLEVGLEAIVGKEEHHVVGGKLSGFVHSLAPWSSS